VVTYPLLCANAKKAVTNPKTGEPVDKHAVYDCISEYCYDKDPEKKWANRPCLARKALTPDMIKRRFAWSKYMRGLAHTAEWYFINLAWADICNSIVPATEKKAAEQALARKGNRTWCSEDAVGDDVNLRGDKRALKMNSWDTFRVWWAPVLSRGRLHVEILPSDFPGDKKEGAETFVARVRAGLNVRLQGGRRRPVSSSWIAALASTTLEAERLRASTRLPWQSTICVRSWRTMPLRSLVVCRT
jgi:hypothetical protein